MYSQRWQLLRKIAATTSFAWLGLSAQTGFAQDGQWQAPNPKRNVEAKIRLSGDNENENVVTSRYRFESTPQMPGGTQSPERSLLNSRFSGFPQTQGTNPAAQAQSPSAIRQASATVPVWQQDSPPAVVPLGPPPLNQDQNQDAGAAQDDDQQSITIDPSNPQFKGLQGTVKIIINEKTNAMNVIGSEEDVAIVEQTLGLIKESAESERRFPASIPLRFAQSEDIEESVRNIYEESSGRTGKAVIEAIRSPNSLLVFGSEEGIETIRAIVEQLDSDVPVPEEKIDDVVTFKLQHLSAADAKRRLEDFFRSNNSENPVPVGDFSIVADYRSNVIVVRGNAQVLQKAKLLIQAIDIDEETLATKSLRVFQLQNAIAADLTIILQDAINGALRNVPQPLQANAQGGGIQPAQNATQQGDEFTSEFGSSKLQLQTIGNGGKVTSGVLFDVRITPDPNSNSIIVRAPESAMPLIEELIKQLDRLPNAETLIKVFQIVNGDAEQLLGMLEAIFGAADAQGGAQNFNQGGAIAQLPLQTATTTPGASLVNLRFAIDQRTNSIIATGPAGDLQVVEDLLNRLDEDLRSRRETVVYRLFNANALDVQESLESLLDARSEVLGADPRTSGGAVLADQEIAIIPELSSNSLIVNSIPENFPEIENIIQRLDRRPPMVKVKVLLAEVSLGSLEEFGVELGIQDSLLFDRGTTIGAGNAITGGTGFDFNSSQTANQNATFPGTLAAQAISNLSLGRVNSNLGYGGLVLSGGSESISVLLRALKDRNCLRVLSRPHIMTLENLQGRVSVGQSVPRITNSTQNQFGGVTNGVEDRDVGVILELTPRVSPDGMITMFTNVIKSSLGLEAEGVAVAVDTQGNVVRQAPINATQAQTTIMARSGQTIVFSGLIQESKEHVERGAPILSDLPVIGPLFKFESDNAARTELLIIMTPYLVDADGVIDAQNADEMERMHWCLCDVAEVYGSTDGDIGRYATGTSAPTFQQQGGETYWSETSPEGQPFAENVDSFSQTGESTSSTSTVNQTGFLEKMKVGMQSPVSRIASRLRGNNTPNRNDRNRRDFDELKKLRNQRQE